jgi:hypothetical protein
VLSEIGRADIAAPRCYFLRIACIRRKFKKALFQIMQLLHTLNKSQDARITSKRTPSTEVQIRHLRSSSVKEKIKTEHLAIHVAVLRIHIN